MLSKRGVIIVLTFLVITILYTQPISAGPYGYNDSMNLKYKLVNGKIIYGYGESTKYATSLRPSNMNLSEWRKSNTNILRRAPINQSYANEIFGEKKVEQMGGKELILDSGMKISNVGVKYEDSILSQFNKTKNSGTNETSIRVIIYLKDYSETDAILSNFSEDEIWHIVDRNVSSRIGAIINEEGFYKLIQDERIDKIYYDFPVRTFLDKSAPLINATYVWNTLNYTGEGVKVCVIDSGVDKYHSDLNGKIVGEYCYCSVSDSYLSSNNCCPDGTSEDNNATDFNGHGTNVVGIIASQNLSYKGVAYGSDIYVVKTQNSSGSGSFFDMGKAIEWCIKQNVNVISVSLGGGGPYNETNNCSTIINIDINNATIHNIPVISASGNEGYNNGINYPACNNQVISVGATYDDNLGLWYSLVHFVLYAPNCWDWTNPDKITCFTNRYKNLSLLAPGAEITSTKMGGGFIEYSGTSQATPHVSGVVALMLEKNSTLTPNQIKQILIDTGKPIWDSETQITYPRVDAKSALEAVPYFVCNATSCTENNCSYSSWTSGSCGGGDCLDFQRQYTRTANPTNCTSTTKCEYDESCIGGGTITVCKGGGCDYTTIQSALNNALADDIIKITDGAVYNEKLNWSTSSDWVLLNCQGATISPASGWAVFAEDRSDWAMINCIINSTAGIKIYGAGSGHEILNNIFDVDEHGIDAVGPDVSRFYIWDNLIFNSVEDGVYFHGDGTDTPRTGYIYRNNFFNNGKGVWLKRTQWNEVFNNTFEDNTYGIYFTGDGSSTLDNTVWDNNLTQNDYGIYMENQGYTTLTNNIICYSNSTYDIYSSRSLGDYGTGNTCERPYVWNDTGVQGCTYYCDPGATATLIYPNDNLTYITKNSVELVCLSEDNNQLANVTLYHNITGTWQANQTKQISGTSNTSVFNINVLNGTKFKWNCLVYDNIARGSFASQNWSLSVIVDTTAPNVNIISPLNQTYNVSSINFNVSLNEEGSCKYSLNKGITNITMETTNNRNFSSINLSIVNGGYLSNFYCEDGVGNMNNTKSMSFSVNVNIISPNDTYKFYMRNSSNSNVAWLGNKGNIVLKGKCFSGGNCNNPGDNSLIFRNDSNYNLGFINSTGDLCITKGDCSGESTNCDSPADGAFIIANLTDYVSYIDGEGDLCLVGELYENANLYL